MPTTKTNLLKILKKILRILRSIFLPFIGQVYWEKRNKIERTFFLLEGPPATIVSVLAFSYFAINYKYNIVLLVALSTWLFLRIVSYGSYYTFISKFKGWPIVISNIFFDLLFITILFDVSFQIGIFDILREKFLAVRKGSEIDRNIIILWISIGFLYSLIFILTGSIRHSIAMLIPYFKKFWKNSRVSKIIYYFILMAIYIVFFFAFFHYLFFTAYNFSGYSGSATSFMDFCYFSFRTLFNSPISDIQPTITATKILTSLESIASYLMLVVFISYLLNIHSRPKYKRHESRTIRRARIFRAGDKYINGKKSKE